VVDSDDHLFCHSSEAELLTLLLAVLAGSR
jgi:hypothetical protein